MPKFDLISIETHFLLSRTIKNCHISFVMNTWTEVELKKFLARCRKYCAKLCRYSWGYLDKLVRPPWRLCFCTAVVRVVPALLIPQQPGQASPGLDAVDLNKGPWQFRRILTSNRVYGCCVSSTPRLGANLLTATNSIACPSGTPRACPIWWLTCYLQESNMPLQESLP